jgi:hypothetical protein
MMARVNEIRAYLKALNFQAPVYKTLHQREGNGCFTCPAPLTCDNNSLCHCLLRILEMVLFKNTTRIIREAILKDGSGLIFLSFLIVLLTNHSVFMILFHHPPSTAKTTGDIHELYYAIL